MGILYTSKGAKCMSYYKPVAMYVSVCMAGSDTKCKSCRDMLPARSSKVEADKVFRIVCSREKRSGLHNEVSLCELNQVLRQAPFLHSTG